MEFSSQLVKVARILLKPHFDSVEVYLHSPERVAHGKWTAVIDVRSPELGKLKGTGTAGLVYDAFLKALVELGENIVVKQNGLQDRNGLSGGLFLRTASQRSKCELLERDAFLFHYREREAFSPIEVSSDYHKSKGIRLFRMSSADDRVFCILATDINCSEGKSECLLIGLGASESLEEAIQKAIAEYSIMLYDHEFRPGWCAFLAKDPSRIRRVPDFHHIQSRSARNIEIFKLLCRGLKGRGRKSDLAQKVNESWEQEIFESPVRLVRYVKFSNPFLMPLIFGKPEPTSGDENLYHPIW